MPLLGEIDGQLVADGHNPLSIAAAHVSRALDMVQDADRALATPFSIMVTRLWIDQIKQIGLVPA